MSTPVDIRVNNFDLLRLLAASQVVLIHGIDHFGLQTTSVASWRWLVDAFPGVPIFFAISGFLISLAYERSPGLGAYLRNRALRLFPALWLCFGVSVVIIVAMAGVDWGAVGVGRVALWSALQLSFGQFYNPDWLRHFGVGVLNGSLWTIPVEMQFYLLVPVIYAALRLRSTQGNAALASLVVVFWAVNRLFAHYRPIHEDDLAYKLLAVSFIPHVYLFLGGMLLQRNWNRVAGMLAGRGVHWFLAYLVVATVLHRLGLKVGTNYPDPWGVPFLLAAIFGLAYTAPTLSDKVLRRNDASYGVYIYHMLGVNVLLALGAGGRWSAVALLFPMTYVAAAASWFLVERRALRRKRATVHAIGAATDVGMAPTGDEVVLSVK